MGAKQKKTKKARLKTSPGITYKELQNSPKTYISKKVRKNDTVEKQIKCQVIQKTPALFTGAQRVMVLLISAGVAQV